MNAYDILLLNQNMLKMMSENGIVADDYKHIQMFKDYTKMKDCGDKISYIVQVLSSRYNLSERSVYRIIKRFHGYCNEIAV